MSYKLVGQEPYQIPSNADLGSLAYQSADAVQVGLVNVANTLTIAGSQALLTVGWNQPSASSVVSLNQVPQNLLTYSPVSGTSINANTVVTASTPGFTTYQYTVTATTASTIIAVTSTYGLISGMAVNGTNVTYGTLITSISAVAIAVTASVTSSTVGSIVLYLNTTVNISNSFMAIGPGISTGTLVTSISGPTNTVTLSSPSTATSGNYITFAPTITVSQTIPANTQTQTLLFYPTITLNAAPSAALAQGAVLNIGYTATYAGGALTVQQGGISVTGNSYMNGTTFFNGSNSTNGGGGAVQITGGLYVGQNLWSNGALATNVSSGAQIIINTGGPGWGNIGALAYSGSSSIPLVPQGQSVWYLGFGGSSAGGSGTPILTWSSSGTVIIPGSNPYTVSNSTATGALVVWGGVGIGGNLNVGGTITATSITVSGLVLNTSTVAISNNVASSALQYITFVSTSSTSSAALQVAGPTGLVYQPSTSYLGINLTTTNILSALHIASNGGTTAPVITLDGENSDHATAINFRIAYSGAYAVTTSSIGYDFYGDQYVGANYSNVSPGPGPGTGPGSWGMNYVSGRSGFNNHWFRDSSFNVQSAIIDNSGQKGLFVTGYTYQSYNNAASYSHIIQGSVAIGTTATTSATLTVAGGGAYINSLLTFDNSYSGSAAGPNKIVMFGPGYGLGVHTNSMGVYSGGTNINFYQGATNSTPGTQMLSLNATLASFSTPVTINGSLSAVSKSFLINHPTKSDMKLRYGSLEGPENGVYVRGRLTGSNTINLPDYWTKLVDPDSITVQITPIGGHLKLYVDSVDVNKVVIKNDGLLSSRIDCYYIIFAERNDIPPLVVEE